MNSVLKIVFLILEFVVSLAFVVITAVFLIRGMIENLREYKKLFLKHGSRFVCKVFYTDYKSSYFTGRYAKIGYLILTNDCLISSCPHTDLSDVSIPIENITYCNVDKIEKEIRVHFKENNTNCFFSFHAKDFYFNFHARLKANLIKYLTEHFPEPDDNPAIIVR